MAEASAAVMSTEAEDEEFRAELQAFLTEHHPGKAPKDPAEQAAWQRQWNATLYEHGWAGPSWPRAYGGMELSFSRQVIYAEEMARARAPGPFGSGHNVAGPGIIKHGTEEQRERWIPATLRHDIVWAQGYSEPEAGSDLPSLRTKAVRENGEYVVNGQKVWSSRAQLADLIYALVRTGPPDSGREGITTLVVDATSPGVTIRPIRDMTGGTAFCEVFFEDVRVPVDNRVGEENGGWPVARTSLGHERAAGSVVQAMFYRRIVDELLELAKERGANEDAVLRQRLADAEIAVRHVYALGARTISNIMESGDPGPQASVARLYIATFEQWLHELAVDVIGAHGMLGRRDDHAVQRGRWVWGMLRTRASTIGAGTAEIQRNAIADNVLGLPRDPSTAQG